MTVEKKIKIFLQVLFNKIINSSFFLSCLMVRIILLRWVNEDSQVRTLIFHIAMSLLTKIYSRDLYYQLLLNLIFIHFLFKFLL
jgi:hypothetical protein